MYLNSPHTTRFVDIIGASLFALCIATSVWLLAFHNDETSKQIGELKAWIRAGQQDAVILQSANTKKKAILASQQTTLAQTGRLPERAPIVSYFRTLSKIAAAHNLQVVQQHPLSERWYPGLLEQRWSYEVSGPTLNLIRFLKAIEDTAYWADVSHLKIDRGNGPDESVVRERVANLTISFFSSPPVDPDDDAEGT